LYGSLRLQDDFIQQNRTGARYPGYLLQDSLRVLYACNIVGTVEDKTKAKNQMLTDSHYIPTVLGGKADAGRVQHYLKQNNTVPQL
jgi:hypothetical protein